MMIRLLIVADQPFVQKGLRMRLDAEIDFCVIGEASDSAVALEMAQSLCPDIVLIDVDMPQIDAIALTAKLHQICPQAALIVLSIHDDVLTCARAESAGARAFIAKSNPADVLLTTIRQVAQSITGGAYPANDPIIQGNQAV